QVAIEPRTSQMHADRGGRADGELERRTRAGADVSAPPGVEDHHRAILPALLLAAHHKLAVPGRRPPVHPAKLVAITIGAGNDVVVSRGRGHPGPAVAVA